MRLLFNIKRELVNPDYESILDLGCGKGLGCSEALSGKYSVGIDSCEIDLTEAKRKNIYTECIFEDAKDLSFNRKSFDLVISFHVIEHLAKEESRNLIKKMEDLAIKKVVIATPNGFVPSKDYDATNFTGHKCGWTADEFKELGYKVIGVDGLKWWGEKLNRYDKKKLFWKILFSFM